jgi:hypothetical protein
MSEGSATRILLLRPGHAVPRPVIDWIAERQRHARVIVPPSALRTADLPGRLEHEPFIPSAPRVAEAAERTAALLGGAGALAEAVEAAALALMEGGVVLATHLDLFRDLIPLSSWSMNLPERTTDGLLVQHLGVAGRMPAALHEAAPEALEAILSEDEARIRRVTRSRRLAARSDGPVRFRRIARKSAGLRPFVVYLDLLPLAGAAAGPFAAWLRDQERGAAESLFSTAAAIFI